MVSLEFGAFLCWSRLFSERQRSLDKLITHIWPLNKQYYFQWNYTDDIFDIRLHTVLFTQHIHNMYICSFCNFVDGI